MSSSFPNGSVFSIFTTQATAVVVSGISNANPGIVTATANGYTNADVVMLTNNNQYLNNRVTKVAGVATNTFNLSGSGTGKLPDTTLTTLYPSGFGVGTSIKMTVPISLSQVTDSQLSGGEQQFYQWTYLESAGQQLQRPTFRNAKSLKLEMDWDPTQTWHTALLDASTNGGVYVLKVLLPTAAELYWSTYISYDGEPNFNINENMKTTVTFSFANPFSTRF